MPESKYVPLVPGDVLIDKDPRERKGKRVVVVDVVGKARTGSLLRATKRGGVCVLVAATLRGYAAAKVRALLSGQARVIGGVASEKPGDLDFLKGLVEAGAFRPVVDRVFSLDDIVVAHAYAQTGHAKGNVVISVA